MYDSYAGRTLSAPQLLLLLLLLRGLIVVAAVVVVSIGTNKGAAKSVVAADGAQCQ